MNFTDVDRRYAELWQMSQAGALSAEQFDQQLHAMMLQDNQGRWWAKARESGDWHYFDQTSGAWVRATPPADAPPSLPAPPAATAAPQSANWAPARPSSAAPAATGAARYAAPAAPATQQTPYAQGYAAAPELGSGMKVIFYILSFLFGLLGIILFFVYRNKPAAEDRSAARLFLLLGVLSMLLSCLCSVTYVALFSSAILQGAGV
jgi:hypothetical protein